MTIDLLAFGIVKEILNSSSMRIEIGSEISAVALKLQLAAMYPRLQQLTSFMIAVNGEYAHDDTMIQPGSEVAIIPPVSGG